jgi:hypothetical protein
MAYGWGVGDHGVPLADDPPRQIEQQQPSRAARSKRDRCEHRHDEYQHDQERRAKREEPPRSRSCSCPRAPTGRPTTASASATHCASRATASCSPPRRSWAGKLEALGFDEDLVDLAAPPTAAGDGDAAIAGQFWTDFIRETSAGVPQADDRAALAVRAAHVAGADRRCEVLPAPAAEIIERQRPDVVIEDNVNCFPALVTAGVPFVRIMSCNPLEMRGPTSPLPTRATRRRPHRLGRVPRRVRPHPPPDVGGVQRVGRRLRRAAARRPRVHPRQSDHSTSTCTPRWSTTSTAARSDRPGTGSNRRCGPPTSRSRSRRRSAATARSSICRSGRSAPPTST